MNPNYIGFADSDAFLAAADPAKPINLNVGTKHGKPGRYGLSVDYTILIMSQAHGDEVLYFEHIVHRYQAMSGEPMGFGDSKRIRLAEQAEQAAGRYLGERGFTCRQALLSMPANYVTLDGLPTFLAYDKSSDSYLYIAKDAALQAEAAPLTDGSTG